MNEALIAEEIQKEYLETITVLTKPGLMQMHQLTEREFTKIENELRGLTHRDILIHYPDGPRRAVALHVLLHAC